MKREGFTLLGLLIIVAAVNVVFAVAVTSWTFLTQRARETELIWRGEQYARALDCYFREQGTFPSALEDLVEARCLRRLYPDPMTSSGAWDLVYAGDLTVAEAELPALQGQRRAPSVPGAEVAQGGAGGSSQVRSRLQELLGSRGQVRRDERRPVREGGLLGRDTSQLRPGRTPLLRGQLGRQRLRSQGGIVGVVSRSTREPIGSYREERRYNEWRFLAGRTTRRIGAWVFPGVEPALSRGGQPPARGQPPAAGQPSRQEQRSPSGRRLGRRREN